MSSLILYGTLPYAVIPWEVKMPNGLRLLWRKNFSCIWDLVCCMLVPEQINICSEEYLQELSLLEDWACVCRTEWNPNWPNVVGVLTKHLAAFSDVCSVINIHDTYLLDQTGKSNLVSFNDFGPFIARCIDSSVSFR